VKNIRLNLLRNYWASGFNKNSVGAGGAFLMKAQKIILAKFLFNMI
jgi:hypothetical protein